MGKKNQLPNSSFEQATVPGWPDYYRYSGALLRPTERIGGASEVWGVDTKQPYHGDSCLRMSCGASHRATYIEYTIDPALTPKATPFVLSTWLRANRDGVGAILYVSGAGSAKRFSLTKQWQRYSLPVTLPAQTSYLVIRWYQNQNQENDVLWMDALQLEVGDTPTDYLP